MDVKHDWFRVGGGPQGRPIAVFLGWVGATPPALQRYAEVYNKFGWDVLAFRFPFLSLWFPLWAFNNAVEVLDCIMQEFVQNGPRQIIFVVYSGAAKMCYYRLLEILGGKHKQQDFCCLYSAVKDHCIGQVFDSSPVDFTSQAGVAFLTSKQKGVMNALKKSGAEFTAGFLDFFLVEWFEKDRQRMWDVLSHPPVGGPLLFLYSLGDHLADAAQIRDMAAAIRGRGRTVVEQVWPDAPHIRLLQTHPVEYVDAVGYFLGLLPGSGPGGRGARSPGRGGGHDLTVLQGARGEWQRAQSWHVNGGGEGVMRRMAASRTGPSSRVHYRFLRSESEESLTDAQRPHQLISHHPSHNRSSSNEAAAASRAWPATVGELKAAGDMSKASPAVKAVREPEVRERAQRRAGVMANMLCGFEEQLLRSCGVAAGVQGLPTDTPFHSSGCCSLRYVPLDNVVGDGGTPLSPRIHASPCSLKSASSCANSFEGTSRNPDRDQTDGWAWSRGAEGGRGSAWKDRWLGAPYGRACKHSVDPAKRNSTDGSSHEQSQASGSSRTGSTSGPLRSTHQAVHIGSGIPGQGSGGHAASSLVNMNGGNHERPQGRRMGPSTGVPAPDEDAASLPSFYYEAACPAIRGFDEELQHNSWQRFSLQGPSLQDVQGSVPADCSSSLNPLHVAGEQLRNMLHHATRPASHPTQASESNSRSCDVVATSAPARQLPQRCEDDSHTHQQTHATPQNRSTTALLLHDPGCPGSNPLPATDHHSSRRTHANLADQAGQPAHTAGRWLNWPGGAFIMHQRLPSKL